jgi:ATP-dependent 26S proteasome regulatory subunit
MTAMDPLYYLILSKVQTGNILFDIMIISLLPLVLLYSKQLLTYFNRFITSFRIFKRISTELVFVGYESIGDKGSKSFDYPFPLLAIINNITINNLSRCLEYINVENNGKYYNDEKKIQNNKSTITMDFMVSNYENEKIGDDLYIETQKEEVVESYKLGSKTYKTVVRLITYKKNIQYLQDFVNKCVVEYKKKIKDNTKDKIYHWIYQGLKRDKPTFSSSVLSDLTDENLKNYETFDTLFFNQKDKIIKDIERLHDIEYYKKTGLKRKKGYIFYGPPGCGKTSCVTAMANYDKRHIIEIPMSRIKTNKEIEAIFNLDSINEVDFYKDQIIILFDEFDENNGKLKARKKDYLESDVEEDIEEDDDDNYDSEEEIEMKSFNRKKKKKIEDELNLGNMLSRLDGIGNYNGLIIVATTNIIKNLDEALYRHQRLNPIKFNYAEYQDVIKMAEKYFNQELSSENIDIIKKVCEEKELTHASLRQYMEENEDSLENFIKYLQNIEEIKII